MSTKKTTSKKASTKKAPVKKAQPPKTKEAGKFEVISGKAKAKKDYGIEPGTTLTREFKGRTIEVHVTDAGFVFEDQTFKSISAVARRITGYMISGPVFFGLTGKDGE